MGRAVRLAWQRRELLTAPIGGHGNGTALLNCLLLLVLLIAGAVFVRVLVAAIIVGRAELLLLLLLGLEKRSELRPNCNKGSGSTSCGRLVLGMGSAAATTGLWS
jgi:hypothetical protein